MSDFEFIRTYGFLTFYLLTVSIFLQNLTTRRSSSLESIMSDIMVGQLQVILKCFQLGSLEDLQDTMKQSGAIISGSTALLLLHPGRFLPNDIDFYVMPPGYHVLLVYLQRCGYQIERHHTSHYPSLRQIRSVHFLHSEESFQCINIIVCEGPHALSTISHFHSTLVMNYISYYGVVCLYPMWTMLNFGFINRDNDVTTDHCLSKYIRRGFKFSRTLGRGQKTLNPPSTHSKNAVRNLHDEDVLFIPFNSLANDIRKFDNAVSWKLCR